MGQVTVSLEGNIFLANSNELRAYTFDGNSFTISAQIGFRGNDGFIERVSVSSGGTIFIAHSSEGLIAFEYSPITSVKEIEIPENHELAQNYPNPFNPSTTIKYSIPKQSNVTLKVFDVLGSEIATLVDTEQPQGNYEIEFDEVNLTSGIYFYRLKAGDFVETKKMILLK